MARTNWQYDEIVTEQDMNQIGEEINASKNSLSVMNTPIGFPNKTDSTFTFNKSTRMFTIEPTGTSYDVYYKNKKYTKITAETIVIPDTTGVHYIYFNKDTGTLETSMNFRGLDNMIYISYIYWNSELSNPSLQFSPGDERHGTVMDKATHAYLHEIVGAEWIRGLQVYGYELDNESDNNAVKLSLTSGVVRDEDLIHSILHSDNPAAFFEQKLEGFAELPVMHKEGVNGAFKQDLATEYPFKNTSIGRVNYNQYTGTEWQQTEVTEGNFVAFFIVYTGLIEEPIKVVQGQREDITLADAQANNDHRNINWGDMPFQEFKVLYRLIFQTSDTYTNDRKVAIREVLDLRAERRTPSGGGGGIIPSAHNNLTGLDYNNSGHTGFASQAALDAHKADNMAHDNLLGKVLGSDGNKYQVVVGAELFPTTQVSGSVDKNIISLTTDENFVYVGEEGSTDTASTWMYKLDKSTLAMIRKGAVPGKTTAMAVDDLNLFTCRGGTTVSKHNKDTFAIASSYTTTGVFGGMVIDNDYVYAAVAGSKLRKLNKSNMELVSETVAMPGAILGIAIDENYIYVTNSNKIVYKIVKSTMAIDNSVTHPNSVSAIAIDDTYIYCGANHLTKFRKSDLGLVSEYRLSGIIYRLFLDGDYILGLDYYDRGIVKLTKSDLVEVITRPLLIKVYANTPAVSDTDSIFIAEIETFRVHEYSKYKSIKGLKGVI